MLKVSRQDSLYLVEYNERGTAMSKIKEISSKTLHEWLSQGSAILIDVREVEEYQDSRIPGSILFPLDSCGATTLPHNPDKKVVFHCKSGRRGMAACKVCMEHQPQRIVYHLDGGIEDWIANGYEVECGVDCDRL